MDVKKIATRAALFIAAALALNFLVWFCGAAMHDFVAPRFGWSYIIF